MVFHISTQLLDHPRQVIPTFFPSRRLNVSHSANGTLVGMTTNQNPFIDFAQLLADLVDAHMEEDVELVECDSCEGLYEVHSRDGRCGECAYCSRCCQHPAIMFWWEL
jgi:hypothetical protein